MSTENTQNETTNESTESTQASEPVSNESNDVDALLESIYAPEKPLDIKGEGEKTESSPKEDKTAPKEETNEYQINYKGEVVKIPKDKTEQYLSKGYDYETKMRDLNISKKQWEEERSKFEKDREVLTQQYSELKQLDDYARENPRFIEAVRAQWEKEKYNQDAQVRTIDPNNPVMQRLDQIERENSALKEFYESQQKEMMVKKEAEVDAKLSNEIMDIRNAYKDLPWDEKDEHGRDLEKRIGDHAIDNGISSFKAAFRDLMFEEVMKRKEMSSLEEAGKKIKQVHKLGLKPSTDEPRLKAVNETGNIRKKSYEELMKEGMEELGLI